MSPYQKLANAIIMQAANDYVKALNRPLLKTRDFDSRRIRLDCERFFKSRWFGELSHTNGHSLMVKLAEQRRVVSPDIVFS